MGVPATAQCLYMWLCDFANMEGESFPSRQLLAQRMQVSVRSVDEYVKILENANLLVKENRVMNNEKTTNIYRIPLYSGADSALGRANSALPPRANSAHRTQSNILNSPSESEDTFRVVDISLKEESERPDKISKREQTAFLPLLKWAESERGFPFLLTERGKQLKALKIAKQNGIKSEALRERWYKFSEDKFWSEKGFDWMNVVKDFNKRV